MGLDRDGTIIEEKHYLADPAGVELLPNAAAGIRALNAAGFTVVVATNQSGLARGYFDAGTLERIHETMLRRLTAEGARLDAIYVCPHHPDAGCRCRKPQPLMLERAAADFAADPTRMVMVGDKPCDIEAGRRFGAHALLVSTGYGRLTRREITVSPDHVVADLLEASRVIDALVGGSRVAAEARRG